MSMTGSATQVSSPSGNIPNSTPQVIGAPGSTGPGAQMGMAGAAALTVGTAAAGLVVLGVLFRRGGKTLPPLRVDAANVLNVYWSWLLVDATLKLLAYKYHGHKVAQAYLLIA